jgi:metal binding Ada-like protein
MADEKTWTLTGANGKPFSSNGPGTLGGHRGSKIYGHFDCRSALAAIARGGYMKNRVFFPDEAIANAAGYRPCGTCMPSAYAAWKFAHAHKPRNDRQKHSSSVPHPPRKKRRAI